MFLKNEKLIKEAGDGENKKTKFKKDDLVLIIINNEKIELKLKKFRLRLRLLGGKKLLEYKLFLIFVNVELFII